MTFSLAIVGRPNVGKSTLFNRLVGKRLALVDDQPGVTRDLREGAARLGDLRFTVIDTAGLEEVTDDSLQGRMRRLTERAVDMADICLFMIDARTGVTPTDEVLAEILRKRARHVILAANKGEGAAADAGVLEAYGLGLGEPIRLSAEHGEGLNDLYAQLMPLADAYEERAEEEAPETDVDVGEEDEDAPRPITRAKPLQIAVVGRPNAGKSTLINQIMGEERLLTGPEAGITRDAISVQIDWAGPDGTAVPMRIFDTAGMRKKAKVQEKLEKLSVSDGLRAVKFAEVVVVLLDAAIPFEQQDLRIADLAEREGRAVVVAVNKWDIEEDKQDKLRDAARGVRPPSAATARRAAGDRLGQDGPGPRPAAHGDHEGAGGLEPARVDRAAQPVAVGHAGTAPAARTAGQTDQAALHDAGQDAPAGLRGDVLASRQDARKLFPLSGQWPCARISTCRARRSGSTCGASRTRTPTRGAARPTPGR